MRQTFTTVLTLAAATLPLPGCVRYQPQPIEPDAHAAAFRVRRLDDPSLVAWLERYGGAPVTGRWTDRQLATAALAHRADLERARRDWLAARAGAVAAGARPAPGAEVGVERAVGGRDDGPPWVVSLAGLFTFELGGKRAARIQAARARETAAEAELARTMAGVLERVRQAALAVRHAEASRDEALTALDLLRQVEGHERARFAEAALGSGEVARTAAEAAAARTDVAVQSGEVRRSRAALAAALAVDPEQVRPLSLDPSAPAACAWGETIGADSLAALALVRRAEVARALADYALAEADVRGRVAAQYPDLELGPGFIWDQGVHRWTLAMALPALLAVRARAPIAAAEADRHAAAGRVAEVQDALLTGVASALEGCRAATIERSVADSQRVAAERGAALVRAAYDRGEAGRLELARAELVRIRAGAAERAAAREVERSGLELELAAGHWHDQETAPWPDPRVQPLTTAEDSQ